MKACRNTVMLIDATGIIDRWPLVDHDGRHTHDRIVMAKLAWQMLAHTVQFTASLSASGRSVECVVPAGWEPDLQRVSVGSLRGFELPLLFPEAASPAVPINV